MFFDWDKYNITPEGHADHPARGEPVPARAVRCGCRSPGYTDTSGSAGYNQRLSERRANAVANALESASVCRVATWRSAVAVINDLRVPTPDGVREPQNRRVEIVFP